MCANAYGPRVPDVREGRVKCSSPPSIDRGNLVDVSDGFERTIFETLVTGSPGSGGGAWEHRKVGLNGGVPR